MFRTKPGEERALIEDWINRPALRKLVEAFGGTWPTGNLETIVEELAGWSETWNYRAGTNSRLMFHEHEDEHPHEELTYEAADELGLMNPKPPSAGSYDYLLILGGLATGVEPRVGYAAELVQTGLCIRRQIAGLGSYRVLQDKELPVSRRYAPEGHYEIDHLVAMMAELFVPGYRVPRVGDSPHAAAALQISPGGTISPGVFAYSALGDGPDGRPANTAETYELFLERNPTSWGQSALLITSAIYVPYQHLDAVRVLGRRQIEVETVGVMSKTQRAHPGRAYRQEIRSMLRSAQRML